MGHLALLEVQISIGVFFRSASLGRVGLYGVAGLVDERGRKWTRGNSNLGKLIRSRDRHGWRDHESMVSRGVWSQY